MSFKTLVKLLIEHLSPHHLIILQKQVVLTESCIVMICWSIIEILQFVCKHLCLLFKILWLVCIRTVKKKQYEINFKISSVVRAVTFSGRQNVALQGHCDRLFVLENCGNFLALLFWQNMMMISGVTLNKERMLYTRKQFKTRLLLLLVIVSMKRCLLL